MHSKPTPPKIGMSDARFAKIGIVCILIVIALCVAAIYYFEEPSSENPYGSSIETGLEKPESPRAPR